MSGESSAALDLLEAELLRDARQELEPDQARIDSLWRGIAATGALGAAFGAMSASVPPASGTGWAAPRPITTPPAAALPATPPPTSPLPATGSTPAEGLAHQGTLLEASLPQKVGLPQKAGLLQRWGHASFGLRALLGAAVGGAVLGFAAGYGSTGFGSAGFGRDDSQRARDPAATMVSTSMAQSAASDGKSSDARQVTPAEDTHATSGATVGSPGSDESQAAAARRGTSTKQQVGPSEATPGTDEQAIEPPKPSFYEELEYLKRAQAALRQGNGALALGLMTSLDAIQPGGALLSERGVIQVLAHCQLGDVELAERVAERLAANGLASVYTERLEKSCAAAVLSK